MSIDDTDFRAIVLAAGLQETAVADALARYHYACETTPVSEWINAQRGTSPHWWKPEPNELPVDDAILYSSDAQAKYAKENGPDALADALHAHGLKVGQVLKRPKQDTASAAEKLKGQNNPWSPQWKGEASKREAEKIRIIKGSASVAAQLAKAAGVTLSGQPLRGA